MRAPRRGISGIFRPGCSGQFVGDSGSMESATLVEMLGNGTLEVTLKEQSMFLKCSLVQPPVLWEYRVREFPTKILPTSSTYTVRNSKIVLLLHKAPGSKSWAGALATRGLEQAVED
ncbi:hypothetical protein FBUS_00681 [Fasciolopsis buskii]|uniref:CS domain-containing protein n=1 Tax=Fasciolopsis buskii TaxID=27845 RepID=A0A8E0RP53_9TREM|nr:hypothetical protein FBUS_00681 [Fasciolopsis buski]